MIKKLLLLILSILVLYGVLVFLAPKISSSVESFVWIPGITEKIHSSKEDFDNIVTNVPSKQEFKSWAIDISDTIKWGLDSTKDKIDNVRVTLSWAQNTIDETFDNIDQAVETVKEVKEVVEKLKSPAEKLQNLGENIQSTVGSVELWDDSSQVSSWVTN